MQLTIEQAIGQKLMLAFQGYSPSPAILAAIAAQHIGGVTLFRALNVVDPAQVRELTDALQRAAQASGQPPLLIAVDQEGGQLMALGGTTAFPGNMALGATGSVDLAYRNGLALGSELAALGVNVNYAPDSDVNVNPSNPVIGVRSFGEDPLQVAQLAAAMIEGIQAAGVAATAKHFPGHGDTSGDTHDGVAVVPHDRTRLATVELPPFAAAIAAGVKLVMSAHVALPAFDNDSDLPATLSARLLRGLLREELGFDGVTISDAMEMRAIQQGPGLVIDAVAATIAGIDLLLLNADHADQRAIYAGLVQATQRNVLNRADILRSAQRVLALKQWVGQVPQPDLSVVHCAEHRALAREIAERSVTLVRDDARRLPLRLAIDARIAVVVPRPVDLTPADTSSYERCQLADAVRHYHAATDEFLVSADPDVNQIAVLIEQLTSYDVIIVGTINVGAQRGQAALVNALLAHELPLITVALRLPYDLAAYPTAPTYLCTYSLHEAAMTALAAALWGEIPTTGRLPVSIPGLYPRGHGGHP